MTKQFKPRWEKGICDYCKIHSPEVITCKHFRGGKTRATRYSAKKLANSLVQ